MRNNIIIRDDIRFSYEDPYQIIPYCIRLLTNINHDYNRMKNGNISSVLTFKELNEQNITIQDLFFWSAPIDLIERYQYYIESQNHTLSSQPFYNCTFPWFGVFCQYTFNSNLTFNDIVRKTFNAKIQIPDENIFTWLGSINLTCYMYMVCNRGPKPFCLDWHEICDGQIHCFDSGIDEMNCFELEINECETNEYRCHNGICIPEQFLNDNPFHPDCLDATDEVQDNQIAYAREYGFPICTRDPRFRCEETNHNIPYLNFECTDKLFSSNTLISRDKAFWKATFMCFNRRHITLQNLFLLDAAYYNLTYECWLLMSCLTYIGFTDQCKHFCNGAFYCRILIRSRCNTSSYVIFPAVPVFQSHVFFGYWTNVTVAFRTEIIVVSPHFLCYDVQRCPFFMNSFKIENYTCLDRRQINLTLLIDLERYFDQCLPVYQSGNETHCSHPSLYHCPNTSKCISKHRLVDGSIDCYRGEDEKYADSCKLNHSHRFQCSSENKCISPINIENVPRDCRNGEDEIRFDSPTYYQNLCNGYSHILPILIDGQNETDETNCQHWPCDNQYTRCDGVPTCGNGMDELNCNPSSKCYPDRHECISPSTFTIECVSVNRTGDGIVDCLGGTDEREYCRNLYPEFFFSHYRCWNESKCAMDICEGLVGCSFENNNSINRLCTSDKNIQAILSSLARDTILKTPYQIFTDRNFRYKYFSLHSEKQLPLKTTSKQIVEKNVHTPDKRMNLSHAWICHRGILVYIGIEKTEHCLCPPNYHGDYCQFQTQRVSLTVKFSKECATSCYGVYGIIFLLIDQNQAIHSYEQLTYNAIKDCNIKYNLYFLYQSRPKIITTNYTIHIHAYNKFDLTHYASWILPVKFLFLPVNRIAAYLIIPPRPVNVFNKCTLACGQHSRCFVFSNMEKQFCLCNPEWSGINCTIKNDNCNCSSDSLCLGIVNNRSICLCPFHKFGSRCFLHSNCQHDTCKNGGQCAADNNELLLNTSTCICPLDYSGNTCEIKQTQMDFSFDNVPIPQSLLLYIITVQTENDPLITMLAKKIPFDQEKISVFTSLLIHLVFVRIDHEYYLSFQQANDTQLSHLIVEIKSPERCPPIDKLFDEHTMTFPLLRRAKYYHIACKEHLQLVCMYDPEMFMCLCNKERFANCFEFNFTKESNCQGRSPCGINGQCFQDLPSCPTTTICVCNECYYGGQCQLTTKGFSLSLDTILGYHIRRDLSILRQSAAVKVSIAMVTIMLFVVLISGTLSIITFNSKNTREVGCGLYLFTLSILSLISGIILTIKVWFLIVQHILLITDHRILSINCIPIEFILRSLPAIADWLSVCITIERTSIVIKSVNFNKKKSKEIARWIIFGVILITIASIIHEPIHRQLVDDDDEKRIWCIVRYSSILQIYDRIMHIVHFIVPFSINLISAIIIIVSVTRTHSNARKKQTYKQYLREQFHEQKHLIISPIILVILGVPRLIISFLSGCMKSVRDPWLFLFGYFISFIPPLIMPIVFIIPSKTYRKELQVIIRRHLPCKHFG